MEEFIEMVKEGSMPLDSYTWTHSDAKLSTEQVQEMLAWAQRVRFSYSLAPQPE